MPVKNNNQPVFARPLAGRGNPEDWSTFAHAATPSFTAGIATVFSFLLNDVVHIGKAYDSL